MVREDADILQDVRERQERQGHKSWEGPENDGQDDRGISRVVKVFKDNEGFIHADMIWQRIPVVFDIFFQITNVIGKQDGHDRDGGRDGRDDQLQGGDKIELHHVKGVDVNHGSEDTKAHRQPNEEFTERRA